MDVVDVSTEWILSISVILNATALDSIVERHAELDGRPKSPNK